MLFTRSPPPDGRSTFESPACPQQGATLSEGLGRDGMAAPLKAAGQTNKDAT